MWTKCISGAGTIRAVALQATDVVRELAERHQVKGEQAKSLGEAMVGALQIASYCKAGQRINLNIRGSGPFGVALVDAYPDGRVRGFAAKGAFDVEAWAERSSAEMNNGRWGEGLLSILRSKEKEAPFIGTVPMLTGQLAKDLAFYWFQSEQLPSAVGIEVDLDPKTGEVASAGGFLIQALSGADDELLKGMQQRLKNFPDLGPFVRGEMTPVELLAEIFVGESFQVIEETELRFDCPCSEERVRRGLKLLGSAELENMLKEDGKADVTCDFCSEHYSFSKDALKDLIRATSSK